MPAYTEIFTHVSGRNCRGSEDIMVGESLTWHMLCNMVRHICRKQRKDLNIIQYYPYKIDQPPSNII